LCTVSSHLLLYPFSLLSLTVFYCSLPIARASTGNLEITGMSFSLPIFYYNLANILVPGFGGD